MLLWSVHCGILVCSYNLTLFCIWVININSCQDRSVAVYRERFVGICPYASQNYFHFNGLLFIYFFAWKGWCPLLEVWPPLAGNPLPDWALQICKSILKVHHFYFLTQVDDVFDFLSSNPGKVDDFCDEMLECGLPLPPGICDNSIMDFDICGHSNVTIGVFPKLKLTQI